MDDLYNEKNVPESAWFKFSKVGDKIGGRIGKIFTKPAVGQFPAQLAFTLLDAVGIMDGAKLSEAEINVGVKDNDYFRPRLAKVKVGDMLGFVFTEEIPTKVKGNSPAKSITPFIKSATEKEKEDFFTKYPDLKSMDDLKEEFSKEKF